MNKSYSPSLFTTYTNGQSPRRIDMVRKNLLPNPEPLKFSIIAINLSHD